MKRFVMVILIVFTVFSLFGCTSQGNDLSIMDDEVFVYLTSLNRLTNNYSVTITDETNFRSVTYFLSDNEDIPYSMMILGYAYVRVSYGEYEGPANNKMIPIFGWDISNQQFIRLRDITLVNINYTEDMVITDW